MELLADVITETLGPEVVKYLTIAEAEDLGIDVSKKTLHRIADAYPTSTQTFNALSTTDKGVNVIHAKVLLGDVPSDPPSNAQFYLNLPQWLQKMFVRATLQQNPGSIKSFLKPMQDAEIRESILPTVIKYGLPPDLFTGHDYELKPRLPDLAASTVSLKAIKRYIRAGYTVQDWLLGTSDFITQNPQRTPRMIKFLVEQLLNRPSFVRQYAVSGSEMQDNFNEILNRPDVDPITKSKLRQFMKLHPFIIRSSSDSD